MSTVPHYYQMAPNVDLYAWMQTLMLYHWRGHGTVGEQQTLDGLYIDLLRYAIRLPYKGVTLYTLADDAAKVAEVGKRMASLLRVMAEREAGDLSQYHLTQEEEDAR